MTTILTALSVTMGQSVYAQELQIAAGASFAVPEVLALDFALRFHPAFTARVSIGGIAFSRATKHTIDLPTSYEEKLGYDPQLRMTHRYQALMLGVLVDYAPIRSFRALHLTGGFFLGRPKVLEDAILVNPNNDRPIIDDLRDKGHVGETLEPFVFEEKYKLQPRHDGSVSAEALLGSLFRPYFGIGIGESVPNKRVGVRFDIGVLLGSGPRLFSEQLIEGDLNDLGDYWGGYRIVEQFVRVMPRIQLTVMCCIN